MRFAKLIEYNIGKNGGHTAERKEGFYGIERGEELKK